jgi:hypothetical protein
MLKVGAVAQLGERLVCNQEATGSIPVSSTRKNGIGNRLWRSGGRVNRFMDSVFGLGPFLIPISAIVIGGIIAVVKMILSHQERIAKIERGIDPDVQRR